MTEDAAMAVVIVGSGLAGYTAAREFRKLDRQTPLVVVSRDAAGFYSKPMLSNALAGRKRPLHTIIPAFMTKGDVRIAFGIMGGWNQSQAHAQFVSDVVDHQMNIQAALELARFTKQSFAGCDVELESRVPAPVREELAARGHQIKLLGTFATSVGGGQAVLRDFGNGINYGASDPRKDGAAIPQPFPPR